MNHILKAARQQSNMALTIGDIRDGMLGTSVWFHLAWQDIKQRYRRSLIGPFWMTISTGVTVAAMGPLYGKLYMGRPEYRNFRQSRKNCYSLLRGKPLSLSILRGRLDFLRVLNLAFGRHGVADSRDPRGRPKIRDEQTQESGEKELFGQSVV